MMGVPAVLTCALAHGRLQLTAFGARDRVHFDSFCAAPRPQLKRNTLGGLQRERHLVHAIL